MPKMNKEMIKLLKTVEKRRDDQLKEAKDLRNRIYGEAYIEYHTKTKGRLEDAYHDWNSKLPDYHKPMDMKTADQWKVIRKKEAIYLQAQKEVRETEPELCAIKDKIQAQAKAEYEIAAEEIEENYIKAVKRIKGTF